MVKNAHLCTGCGTCVGICPADAIRMERNTAGVYVPTVQEQKCNGCKLCLEVCPGYSINFDKLNMSIFGKSSTDILLGNKISCYLGHSTDKGIRWNASSGGIVTALLIFGLEEGIIDGALVTKLRDDAPLVPEVILARTKEEVLSALGSKYSPVPLNTAIKKILKDGGKYAVVGLPCHIQGIRKAEMLDKKLKKKVVLHIGLFCSHITSSIGTELLLEKIGVNINDVAKLSYRGHGWPGEMSIELKNGLRKSISYTQYWDSLFGAFFFTPIRCTLCSDATNELSDVSVGDAWLTDSEENGKGESIIVARTNAAEKLLRAAQSKGKIHIIRINCDHVKQSQSWNLKFKKKALEARVSLLRRLGKKTPYVNSPHLTDGIAPYLSAILPYLSICLSSKKHWQSILKYVPFPMLRTYFRVLCALLMLI